MVECSNVESKLTMIQDYTTVVF